MQTIFPHKLANKTTQLAAFGEIEYKNQFDRQV